MDNIDIEALVFGPLFLEFSLQPLIRFLELTQLLILHLGLFLLLDRLLRELFNDDLLALYLFLKAHSMFFESSVL